MQPIIIFLVLIFTLTANANVCPTVTKLGHCPKILRNSDYKSCAVNTDCSDLQICCSNGVGGKSCSDPAETKRGRCPSSELINPGLSSCLLDVHCEGFRKCCPSGPCSFTCSDPIYGPRRPAITKYSGQRIFKRAADPCFNPKYGSCPAPAGLLNAGGSCYTNGDCQTNQLCCPNEQGLKRCSDPRDSHDGVCKSEADVTSAQNATKCYLDANCNAEKKCCKSNTCNYFCTEPDTTIPANAKYFTLDSPKKGECPIPAVIDIKAEKCDNETKCSGNRLCCYKDETQGSFCSDPYTSRAGKCPQPWALVTDGAKSCSVDKECTENRSQKCCKFDGCTYYCSNSTVV